MSGPCSPKRKAKDQHAREKKARFQGPKVNRDHVPNENSIVRQLSHELTPTWHTWWVQFSGPGKDFANYKGNRGDPEGAMAWVRDKYVTEWWDQIFPEAKEASKDDRVWFCTESGQGRRIWTYLNNSLRTKKPKANEDSSEEKVKPKQRAIGHDAYRNEHPKKYEEALQKWEKEHGSKAPFHEKRKISYNVYSKLSNQQQKHFKDKAITHVKESRRLAKITDPVELAKYTKDFWVKLRDLLKEVSEMAGIEMAALIVHETEEGKTRVTRELSEGIKGFVDSTRFAKSMDALKEYLEAVNDPANVTIPSPMVYPDFAKDGYPCLPDFTDWSLRRMRKLLRDFIKAVFKFQGGVGRMMWKEIKAAMDYWLDRRRLPKVPGLIWDDPAYLSKAMVRIWLTFFMACLAGVIPPEVEQSMFARIPTGPTPIHPSESQETRREQVERDGRLVTVLVFENNVTKCHRVGGMTYDQRAIDFANFVGFKLPYLTSLAPLLPEAAKTRVLKIIGVVNAFQEHLPAALVFGYVMEVSHSYSLEPHRKHLTLLWCFGFPVFQGELYGGDVILHKPSNTFYGGYTGIVCIARALIRIYLNCLAVRGDFEPPEAILAGYDISRFNVQEHDRIVSWMDNWSAIIERQTKILSETSDERKNGLAQANVRATSDDSDTGDSHDSDSNSDSDSNDSNADASALPPPSRSASVSATSAASFSIAGPSQPIAGPSKLSKGKQRARACRFSDDDESEDVGPEADYD
ncbi:hypothetical protein RSAG8_12811, partial [Rhizoctonia solani AG-8 WAC10335]